MLNLALMLNSLNYLNKLFMAALMGMSLIGFVLWIVSSSKDMFFVVKMNYFFSFGLPCSFWFFFDSKSFLFLFSVSVISLFIYLFSESYMSGEKFKLRFHLLLFSFVLSMVLLISGGSWFIMIVGWDLLGVTSYLLVVYFQNQNCYNAGLITIFSNRVGDVLLIVLIGGLGLSSEWVLSKGGGLGMPSSIFILLMVACFTKSAQIPFSAWLPAAMAAPTPVSSLVHSSTLVTAGVFVLIRYEECLSESKVGILLMIVGCVTMSMASLCGMGEMDLKKMVALSTLSQLGLMMCMLSLGFSGMAFFHLVIHAYFKALLFMVTGGLIHNSLNYQDFRKSSINWKLNPLSSSVMFCSNISLCGFPFMSGFYSKDFFMELSLCGGLNLGLSFLFLISIALTLLYSIRFSVKGVFYSNEMSCLHAITDKDGLLNKAFFILWSFAIFMGSFLSWSMFSGVSSGVYLTMEMKNCILLIVGVSVAVSGFVYFGYTKKSLFWLLGNLMNLRGLSGEFLKKNMMSGSHSLMVEAENKMFFLLFNWGDKLSSYVGSSQNLKMSGALGGVMLFLFGTFF